MSWEHDVLKTKQNTKNLIHKKTLDRQIKIFEMIEVLMIQNVNTAK